MAVPCHRGRGAALRGHPQGTAKAAQERCACPDADGNAHPPYTADGDVRPARIVSHTDAASGSAGGPYLCHALGPRGRAGGIAARALSRWPKRSEEHTSELQSLMRISYAVFCLKKKKTTT